MRVTVSSATLELCQGNIVHQEVDAIVNAANQYLIGGGGVDGAIHDAGGPTIMEETKLRYPNGCPTGSAVASTAGLLKSRFIFHAVGPVWSGGLNGEPAQLKSAIQASLELAVRHQCHSIALPAISTGVYGYPVDLAAEHSLSAVVDHLLRTPQPELVRFVLFSKGIYGAFARVLEGMLGQSN